MTSGCRTARHVYPPPAESDTFAVEAIGTCDQNFRLLIYLPVSPRYLVGRSNSRANRLTVLTGCLRSQGSARSSPLQQEPAEGIGGLFFL